MRAKLLPLRVGIIVGLIVVISPLLLLSTATVKAFPLFYLHAANDKTATLPAPENSVATSVPETPKTDDELFAVQTRLQAVLPEEYVDYEVWSLHLVDDWAYFALVRCEEVPSRIGECRITHFRITVAEFLPGTNEWNIYVEGTDEYLLALERVPSQLQWLVALGRNGAGPVSTDGASVTYSIAGLPWSIGTSWRFNQGPAEADHLNEFDFGVPVAGVQNQVYAAEAGTVVATSGTCVWIQRAPDGLRLFYQHVEPSDISNLTVGRSVNRGDLLGRTTTSPGCGGTTTNHHLHFSFYSPYSSGVVLNPQGFSMNGWLVQGNTLAKGDQVRTANFSNTVLYSDVGSLSASWQNPSSSGQMVSDGVRLQANVSGGSGGINRVSFSANYNGGWKGLATVYQAPYQYDWNLCSPLVQNGDVELGLEVWDNAGNKWVYSYHYENYHINVQNPSNCGGSGTGTWRAEYYDSQDMWWNPNNTNWHSCGEDLSGPTLDKNYGTSAPCSGMRNNGDQWVGDYQGRITFSPGTYVFYSDHNDGARLWVEGLNNNNSIMGEDNSGNSKVCNGQTGYYLDGGKNIRVMLREDGDDARIKLWWDTNTSACLPTCYGLSTSVNPSSSGWIGLDPQPNCAGGYTAGTNVQLTANPYSGYSFANWSGDLSGATSPTSITINSDKSVTANFSATPCYILTTSANPAAGGTVSTSPTPNCGGGTGYTPGTVVQLTASANAGYSFVNWTGDLTGATNPGSITMNGNKTVSANFLGCYALTHTHTGSGSHPAASPANSTGCSAGQYVAGESINLTATPASEWRVSSWSGTDNDGSTATSNSLTMPAGNHSVGVNYEAINNTPLAPSNLRQIGATQTSLTTAWDDNSNNESGFKVYRWNGTIFAYLAPVGTNVTSFTESSLACGATLAYQVTAYNGSGESVPTAWINASTSACIPDTTAPDGEITQPSEGADIKSSSVRLEGWGSDDGSGFNLARLTANYRGAWHQIGDFTSSPFGFDWDMCAAGVSVELVTIVLDLWDKAGNWIQSPRGVRHFTKSHNCNPVPSAPSNLRQTGATQTSLTISWDDNSNNESGFKVYLWNGAIFAYLASVGVNVTSFTESSLSCGATLAYLVTAYNGSGESDSTAWINASTSVCAPTCYALTRTHSGSGSDPAASPANSTGCSVGQYVADASINLTASPTTGWRVASWSGTNNDGSTSASNSLIMPTSDRTVGVNYAEIINPPPAPSLLLPENGATVPWNNGMTFFWNVAAGATEYLTEWWGGPHSATQPCGWNSSTSCYVGHMAEGNTYYWHVMARNSAGESAWSNTWTFTVNPAPDTTAPDGDVTQPSEGATVRSSSVRIEGWGSDDDSGFDLARFTANYSGTWHLIGEFTSSPFGFDWDMCAAGVSDEQVTIALNLWDKAGNYTQSPRGMRHFTKSYNCNPPPPAPLLNSPGNGSTLVQGSTVILSWSGNAGGGFYAELATDSNFSTVVATYGWYDPASWNLGTPTPNTYYWRVKTRYFQESAWSNTWSFTVQPQASVIQPGVRIVGAIASPGKEDAYRYSAGSAGWISVRMFSDGSLDPLLKLTTDGGGLLTAANSGTGSSPEFFSHPLPGAGAYRVVAAGSASTTGGYRLALVQGRGATECDINYDCVVDDLDKDKMTETGCWKVEPVPSGCLDADVNLDGKVDVVDLARLLNQWGRTCIVENAPTVVVGLQGSDVRLSWGDNAMNTGGYIVWRSTDPFFQPDDTKAISTALPAGTTSYIHSGAASSGLAWFYLVQGVSGAGVRSSVSNRTGIFGFGLMPGALQGMTPPSLSDVEDRSRSTSDQTGPPVTGDAGQRLPTGQSASQQ